MDDLEELVDLDILSFRDVYAEYDLSLESLRSGLLETFLTRFETVGTQWTEVLETDDGTLVGFLTACPTAFEPQDFESWEQITNAGTLDGTFDPSGETIYVVTLTIAPGVMATGAHNMLFLDFMGKAYRRSTARVFFESRIPGFRRWLAREVGVSEEQVDALPAPEKLRQAQRYAGLTRHIDGRERPLDPLLRSFSYIGADFVKVVPDAYRDYQSLNFGVVTVVENRLPDRIRRIRPVSVLVGSAMRAAAKRPSLVARLM